MLQNVRNKVYVFTQQQIPKGDMDVLSAFQLSMNACQYATGIS
jgi:hypothetical protein